MHRETHRLVVRDGIELQAQVLGDGPEALLCLPGLARSARDFERFAATLTDRWRAICPDYRGRGRSGRDPKPSRYHAETYAADVLEWLDALALERLVLLGSSFGGWVAVTAAHARPDRIRGVVLNDIGATVPRAAALQYMQLMARRADPAIVDPAFNRQMRQALRAAPFLGVLCRLGFMRHSAPVVTGFREPLRSLAAPLLVLRGERSRVLTDTEDAELRALRPDAEIVRIAGAGHTPTLEEPAAVRALREFLDRVVTDAPA